MPSTQDHFPNTDFSKQDASDDDMFYQFPRMVAHIDDSAIAYLRDEVYAEVLPANGRWLDLMSSRYSHLPDDPRPTSVSATGMNGAELRANPDIDDFILINFNKSQQLPHDDATYDAAMCCVSVQYLQYPVEVFTEVRRVLVPGAPFVVSFSNRCFPTKAVRAWRERDDEGHVQLVSAYMEAAGFSEMDVRRKRGGLFAGDPLYAVIGQA